MASIFDQLNYWIDKNPNKKLYTFLNIDGEEVEQYTYQSFHNRIEAIASHLQHRYNFKKNDRILLAYPPGLEMICAFFACAKIGLIPVPVYPPTSHGFQSAMYKINYIAKDCQAAAVLTNREYYWSFKLNLTRNNLSTFSFKKEYVSKVSWIITQDFKSLHKKGIQENHTDILFLQYTSGSTSHPKGVKVTHDNIIHNCEIVVDHLPIGVSWLPQYHDMGLIGYYLFFALKGGTTYGFSPMDFIQRPALWLETITKYKGTASSAPNFAYEYCLRPGKIPEETYENLDLSSLQFLMTAAEPINAPIYNRFLNKFKAYGLKEESFFAAFGLAEFSLAVSNYGRKIVTVDKDSLKQNKLELITEPTETSLDKTTQIMSCGKPLGDTIVKIVNADKHTELQEGEIGEIWLNGKSKCLGYWNKSELTQKMFNARMVNSNFEDNSFLRTGDLGFLLDGELFICGRIKDMIIIRGLNYYPQDIEKVVESASPNIRKGCSAAISTELDGEEHLIVVAEVKNTKALPQSADVISAIRKFINIEVHEVVFIPPRTIPKTSSGKIARHKTKQAWLSQELKILESFSAPKEIAIQEDKSSESPFEALKIQYGLKGNELQSLGEIGIGSLDLAVLIHDIKTLLKNKGATALSKQIDLRLLQEISVSELFELAEQFENTSALAISSLRNKLAQLQKEYQKLEQQRMLEDIYLNFEPNLPIHYNGQGKTPKILLTGGTGFFGPFILKSLLEHTTEDIYILVRATDEKHGKERLLKAFGEIGDVSKPILDAFEKRVIPVCGDLGKANLGLNEKDWNFLTNHITTIYNNGAIVNYLYNYDKMRDVNVEGTSEIIKFALEGVPKIFNHVSTTFIFGWAVKDVLLESDTNPDLDLLDFGYSQTKWVSEQILRDAMEKGLKARIFRPALITPSINGGGNNFDISIRLLVFMINYRMGIGALNQVSFTPADVAANNIVAVSKVPNSINQTFHVTRDHYANMTDITNIIEELTGLKFKIYPLSEFVPAVISRCTKEDLLFPLLDFFTRSIDNISSMEFKRYDSSNYQTTRNSSPVGAQDPTLKDTIRGMLIFMQKRGLIDVPLLETAPVEKA